MSDRPRREPNFREDSFASFLADVLSIQWRLRKAIRECDLELAWSYPPFFSVVHHRFYPAATSPFFTSALLLASFWARLILILRLIFRHLRSLLRHTYHHLHLVPSLFHLGSLPLYPSALRCASYVPYSLLPFLFLSSPALRQSPRPPPSSSFTSSRPPSIRNHSRAAGPPFSTSTS
ncbi:hypothetical protein FB451DRAFT_659310 [Mycena latifolia]|nr:hypothetical protein FB451DRAFT_659310 [Mycena latifolia]